MPKDIHDKLHQQAIDKGLVPNTEPYNRYVYGTLKKIENNKDDKGDDLEIEPMPTEESLD